MPRRAEFDSGKETSMSAKKVLFLIGDSGRTLFPQTWCSFSELTCQPAPGNPGDATPNVYRTRRS